MALLALFRTAGALAISALVVDVGYVQFVEPSLNETASGDPSGLSRDLFEAYVPDPWDDVVRISVLTLSAVGAVGMLVEALCPLRRREEIIRSRPAGTLVASSTSGI